MNITHIVPTDYPQKITVESQLIYRILRCIRRLYILWIKIVSVIVINSTTTHIFREHQPVCVQHFLPDVLRSGAFPGLPCKSRTYLRSPSFSGSHIEIAGT